MLEEAKRLAAEAHAGQRYGAKPYTHHLEDVARLLEPYGEVAQVVGYLHDIVEDTETDLSSIEGRFGKLVADCVAIVTDESGANRAERKQKTNDKLAAVQGGKTLALIVKTADRLANVNACVADCKHDLLRRYQSEHAAFRSAVYRKGLCDDLWERLDGAITRHPAAH